MKLDMYVKNIKKHTIQQLNSNISQPIKRYRRNLKDFSLNQFGEKTCRDGART